ncbi:dihydrofolate reductase family protein [Nocardioides nematodiphilus]|uniref:dihydrofolate reductase family protein n=1 Tax=Nocardioides nematodiphilus TaxID=2849669 RepID=UPI001CD97F11|nr:dihydrofolate reductase family protein [Nocardioides nematodiphilus]MCA1982517.1 dihydrofolate reductase family protein [Nocardioides nematodiphilus]
MRRDPIRLRHCGLARRLPRGPGRLAGLGAVADLADELRSVAAGEDVWIVGGGDLAGQFHDAGLLDEIRVSIAAVTLGAGAPLLPRRLESSSLRLEAVKQTGQFAELRYTVLRDGRQA